MSLEHNHKENDTALPASSYGSQLSLKGDQSQTEIRSQDYADGALRAWSTVVGTFILHFYAVGLVGVYFSSHILLSAYFESKGLRFRSVPGLLHNDLAEQLLRF